MTVTGILFSGGYKFFRILGGVLKKRRKEKEFGRFFLGTLRRRRGGLGGAWIEVAEELTVDRRDLRARGFFLDPRSGAPENFVYL
ncbi:hypothetical protein SDC9_23053 [bioreactor metagenome]|uniref:Uncharacterized protein n=1 Tax=bioreactor metagenome TaxID=1076179 RepID=A0A644UEA4_9ZZZZ